MSCRADFPILINNTKKDTPFVYLDSAATSLTPLSVTDEMMEYYHSYRSNIHRGLYESAERATEAVESTRHKVGRFFGSETDEVIFTSGATAAANHLALLVERNIPLTAQDEIVVSEFSHSSLFLPLQELAARSGAKFMLGTENLGPQTKVFAMPLMSNVTGEVYDVKTEFLKAKEFGAFCVCDVVAAAGHIQIDMHKLGADAMFVSAHKMFGPTGVGALFLRAEYIATFLPVFFGGGMPEEVDEHMVRYVQGVGRFEPGTLPIAEIIGFGAAVSYIEKIGQESITKHMGDLTRYARTRLSQIEDVEIYGTRDDTGIISFNIKGIHSHDVAQILAEEGVCIRAGTHCAHHSMKSLVCNSTCRVSVHIYNTTSDIDMLIQALKKAKGVFE